MQKYHQNIWHICNPDNASDSFRGQFFLQRGQLLPRVFMQLLAIIIRLHDGSSMRGRYINVVVTYDI